MIASQEEITKKIAAFVGNRSQIVSASDIQLDTKLFSSGLLDSLAFVDLVTYIEEAFDIRLSDTTEVTAETVDSIGQVVQIILNALERKKH